MMTDTPMLPSYQEIVKALKSAQSDFDASQLHGLFCGLICATSGEQKDDLWKQLVFGEDKPSKGLEDLERLYEMSYHLLSEFSFEFVLLLPGDTKEIALRTEKLGLWCQGFLAGLEQFDSIVSMKATEDAKDALNDIIEIAQVNFDDITDSDDDESAYFELVEYVRLSVLMIFQDLRAENSDDESEGSIH